MKTFKTIILCSSLITIGYTTAWGQQTNKNDLNKQTWIKNHKDVYLNQGGQSEFVPEFTSKEEKAAWFNSNQNLSPNAILPNGDIITDATPSRPRIRSIFPSISSFPVYTQTGNKSADDQNYHALKEAWINQHAHQYDQMVQTSSTPVPQKERLANDLKIQK